VESVVILGLLFFLIAAVMPVLYHLRKRIVAGESRLQFWQALHRRGLGAADTEADQRALAVALRRCTLCPRVDDCNEWLASGEREGLERFCPNAAYLKRLERP
jgi:hypothetical protein